MTAVWVFDELRGNITQRDLIMLLASAKLWSIHRPLDKRVLYCSEFLGRTLGSPGIPKIFNEVIPIINLADFSVDTRIFWSYPKLRVLLNIKEPICLIDHDFLTFDDLPKYLDPGKVVYCYTENAKNYYPSNLDPKIRNLSYKARWPEQSANVSFLQLPFPEWTQFYAGTSIQIMEEFTQMTVPDSRYLIFAEQMVLKHLSEEVGYQSLLTNIFECKTQTWSKDKDPNGVWDWQDALWKKFIHYGPHKHKWSRKEYNTEMKFMCEVAGFPLSLLDITASLRK